MPVMPTDSPAFWTEAQWQAACPPPSRPIDKPEPGYFRLRQGARSPWSPARIYAYRPRVAGTDHLAAHIAGNGAEVDEVWLRGRPIDEAHYQRLMAEPPADPTAPVSRRKVQTENDDVA